MAMKLLVAIGVTIVMAFAVLTFVKRTTAPKGTGKKEGAGRARRKGPAADADTEAGSTQSMTQAADIRGCALVQRDGTAVAYVKVEAKNNSLLNSEELVREIESTAKVIAGINHPFKIVHIQVPVDTTRNLAHMAEVDRDYQERIGRLGDSRADNRARKQLEIRRATLANYRRIAEYEAKAATKMRSETYIVVPGEAPEVAEQRARDLRGALKTNGYNSTVLFGEDIVSLHLSYLGAHRTMTENLTPYAGFPVVPEIVEGRYGKWNEEECAYEEQA